MDRYVSSSGIICNILHNGDSGPFIYWGVSPNSNDFIAMANFIKTLSNDAPFHLVAFEVKDWNADFSPWKANAVLGKEAFAGKAQSTLDELISECILRIEAGYNVETRYIAGYSLAGLFALWAFLGSKYFAGVASCSGSLWFPHWLGYIKETEVPYGCNIYLSLGDAEEKQKIKLCLLSVMPQGRLIKFLKRMKM